ncbi:MAG: DUF2325 domain-containing protein [Xanthobacteraceae bacterium]|nr:MAG: DUF2325 domain-containing protein [Xanthobacteraceae bacterium]
MSSIAPCLFANGIPPVPGASDWLPHDHGQTLLKVSQPLPIRQLHMPTRRTRIWELHESFHCSIIGTCFSTVELRRVLIRIGSLNAETASDHRLHNVAVQLAQQSNKAAKMLQKALDRRHQVAINQFSKIKNNALISEMWERALRQGDIPGAYWAVLTHPITSEAVCKKAFSDVHMLSHLVGAANRADIQRLRQLEEDNAALTAKLDRQQKQIRDGFAEREEIIRKLREALSQASMQARNTAIPLPNENASAWTDTIASLNRSLSRETARRERFEQRLAVQAQVLEEIEKTRRRAESKCRKLDEELAALEARIGMFLDAAPDPADRLDLHGLTMLYVGGRRNQVPQLKALTDRVNGHLLHHDGGIDDNPSLLPGLVSQSDVVIFPVDCISHGAATSIKRLSHKCGKHFVPLRTSSLTCLLSTLSALPAPPPGHRLERNSNNERDSSRTPPATCRHRLRTGNRRRPRAAPSHRHTPAARHPFRRHHPEHRQALERMPACASGGRPRHRHTVADLAGSRLTGGKLHPRYLGAERGIQIRSHRDKRTGRRARHQQIRRTGGQWARPARGVCRCGHGRLHHCDGDEVLLSRRVD